MNRFMKNYRIRKIKDKSVTMEHQSSQEAQKNVIKIVLTFMCKNKNCFMRNVIKSMH